MQKIKSLYQEQIHETTIALGRIVERFAIDETTACVGLPIAIKSDDLCDKNIDELRISDIVSCMCHTGFSRRGSFKAFVQIVSIERPTVAYIAVPVVSPHANFQQTLKAHGIDIIKQSSIAVSIVKDDELVSEKQTTFIIEQDGGKFTANVAEVRSNKFILAIKPCQ